MALAVLVQPARSFGLGSVSKDESGIESPEFTLRLAESRIKRLCMQLKNSGS
jgi:hypothetical protein